eukprot:s1890_g2.t1
MIWLLYALIVAQHLKAPFAFSAAEHLSAPHCAQFGLSTREDSSWRAVANTALQCQRACFTSSREGAGAGSLNLFSGAVSDGQPCRNFTFFTDTKLCYLSGSGSSQPEFSGLLAAVKLNGESGGPLSLSPNFFHVHGFPMLARARTSGLPFWIIVLLVRSLLGVRDREGRESLQRDGALIVVTSAVVVENETEEERWGQVCSRQEPQVLELPSFDDEGKMHLASGRYKVSEGSGVVHLKAPLECEIHADGATLILDAPLEIDCPVHFYGKLSIWASKTDLAPLIRVNTDAVVHETADLMFQGLREFKTHEAMGGLERQGKKSLEDYR